VGRSALSGCKIHLPGQRFASSTPLFYMDSALLSSFQNFDVDYLVVLGSGKHSLWRVCLMSEHTRCYATDVYIDNSFTP